MVTTCTPRTSPKRSGQHNSLRNSPPTAVTPPTPSDVEEPAHHVTPVPSSPLRSPLRHLSAAMQTPALCTPANPALTISPPPDLRRDSLTVPCSATLRHLCKGSGVSVYRLERSPDRGVPRSPWVLKKANVSPLAFREVRRVESTLTHEARLLSQISHPHIVGFRAAQRLPDGHLCLALEACECSLHNVIEERQFTAALEHCPLFEPSEIVRVSLCVALALRCLHEDHKLLHGDVKSSNVLVSRDLASVKLCDLGVSLPLSPDLASVLRPETALYEGTEPWRPPEALCGRPSLASPTDSADGRLRICDRSDIFPFGLVLWEMLAGSVPHAHAHKRDAAAYKLALGTRPPLPRLPSSFLSLRDVFVHCTERLPANRPRAATLTRWLDPDCEEEPTPTAE